ncbi:MAG: cytidylate kinase family protein [Spirochaetaceae bacterium]|nr:cytidylate kinase family protein [Spirochaetaceae bacterium]
MAIIAIARELASLGEEIANELASATGYKLVDREYVEKRLGDYGLGPEKRQKYDEKKPGLWASLSQERDDFLHYLKTVIYEEAAAGGCIIMGRGSGAILRGVPNLASVRIIAPTGLRAERIRKLHGCDERRALQILDQSDHDRSGFHKYFFAADWNDPREYGLVVNTGELSLAESVRLIDQYRAIVGTPEREEAGRRRIAELLLGQRVVTEIVYGKKLPIHFLEAEGRGKRIVLHGVANTQSAIDAAVQAARGVRGVEEVESAIQIVQEFTVMP